MRTAKPSRQTLLVSLAVLTGLVIVVVSFVGYLTPAALVSLLTANIFCG